MSNEIYYKGFTGTINYCNADNILYGKITNVPVTTLFSYHGDTIEECINAFHESVEDLISMEDDSVISA